MIMEELLHHLETKIRDIVDQHHSLKSANVQLNQGKHQLVREKEALLVKQKKAIAQIESLVTKLKTIEKLP